jgi:protein TonB
MRFLCRVAMMIGLALSVAAQNQPDNLPVVTTKDAKKMTRTTPRPRYPDAAKYARVQGNVVIRTLIGADGRVAGMKVLSGPMELRQASLDAVGQWEFYPLVQNGQPTAFVTDIEVNYAIQ